MGNEDFQPRCISLLSRSYPVAQIEENLQKFRSGLASSKTVAVINGLRELLDLYDGVEELLRLPSNPQHLHHLNGRKWVEDELELSLRLLDFCGVVRDGLASTREYLQDIQISLRRNSYSNVESNKSQNALRLTKKKVAISLRSLQKKMESVNKIDRRTAVGAGLIEARGSSFTLLKQASSLLAQSRKSSKKVACEEIEVEEGVLCGIIFNLDSALESLFRRLIQVRVLLLNILSF